MKESKRHGYIVSERQVRTYALVLLAVTVIVIVGVMSSNSTPSPVKLPNERNTIGALIFSDDGHLLVGRRRHRNGRAAGSWQPVQGARNDEETSDEQAARDEVWEEIGIAPEYLKRVTHAGSLRFTYWLPRKEIDEEYRIEHVKWVLFHCSLPLGAMDTSVSGEFSDLSYVNWSWLIEMSPTHKTHMFEKLQAEVAETIIDYTLKLRDERQFQHFGRT